MARLIMVSDWQYFHAYRHLAEEGTVKHITCPDCGTKMVTRMGEDDEPVLWCYTDDTILKPGLDLIHQIRAVVNEHLELG